MSPRLTASGEFFLPDPPLERMLRDTRQPNPEPAELGRVFATVRARVERRRQRWTRVAIVGVPIACTVALAIPLARREMPEAVLPPETALPATEVAHPAADSALVVSTSKPPVAGALASHAQHRTVRHTATVPATPANAEPVDLDAETQRLQQAILQLRQGHNALGALATLDSYFRAYPTPHFGPEARFFRIQALVGLGRRSEALAEMTPERLTVLPRRAELMVLRGELFLQLGRASEARDAFDLALSQVHDETLMVRALSGKAAAGRELSKRGE